MKTPNLKTCSRLEAIEWFLNRTNKIIADMREQIDTVQSYRDNNPYGSQLEWDSDRDKRELAQMEKYRDGLMWQLACERPHVGCEAFAPGEYITDEITARGMAASGLHSHLPMLTEIGIGELLAGRIEVTPAIAWGLERAFGSSAQTWLNLEASYQKAKANQQP